MNRPSGIDEYIRNSPPEIQRILTEMRQTIRQEAPDSTEAISYGMPTFKLYGKNLVHFAAMKNHLGFYPTSSPLPVFSSELAGYKTSKGTIRFKLDREIPLDLVRRIVRFRVLEMTARYKPEGH